MRRGTSGRPARPDARYDVTIAPGALTRVLLVAALTLLAYHAGLALYHYRVQELSWLLRQLFDVDQENNLPTWYSGFLLLVSSMLLWLCARKKRTEGDRWFRHWYVLAVGFLLMSIDEVAGIHESINSIIVMPWSIPAGIAVGVIGITFVPFLLHLPRATALRFSLAGAAYLTGALLIEIRGNELVRTRQRDTLEYNMTTLVEESLEMLAVVLFIHSLLLYMRCRQTGKVSTSVEVA